MRRPIRPLLLALVIILAAIPAAAQELRVRAESAAIHAEPSPASRVVATVAKGATLIVVREAGDWWLVRHGSTGSQGYVQKSAVEASAGAPAAPAPAAPGRGGAATGKPAGGQAAAPGAPGTGARPGGAAQGGKPSGPAPAASPKKGAWTDVGWFALNGLYQNSSASFDDRWSWALNAETARATASYALKGGVAYDAALGFRVWKNLGVGVGASYWSLNGSGQVEATLPHPLYLRRDRSVAGSLEARRQETAAHLQVAWVAPVGRRVLVTLGAGPSYFTVKQDLAEGLRYGESYPFDEASFTFAESRTAAKSALGFNAGIDVGYFFTTTVGVGVAVRYAGATASLAGTGTNLSLKAGGLQAGIGLRVRIPKASPKPPGRPPVKPAAKPAPKPPAKPPVKTPVSED